MSGLAKRRTRRSPQVTSSTKVSAGRDAGIEGSPAVQRGSGTLTKSVYEQLRSEVLSGQLKPGEKLGVEALRLRFTTGSSPVREALNRMLSQGLVELEEQKGFRVAPVSLSELAELVVARCWIDGAAITEAIQRFEPFWEEGLILKLHRLSKLRRGDSRRPEWEQCHKELHSALVAGCGSRWIVSISGQLFDAAERYRLLGEQYRLLGASEAAEANELADHRAIVAACFDRNSSKAVELIKAHYSKSFEVISKAFRRNSAS